MFYISNERRSNSELPIITNNYKVLHYDEFPILFVGTNKYGNKLIGSFVSEDDESNMFRYIHVIVNDESFHRFFNKEISYLNILMSSNDIFIIDKNINDSVVDTFLIPTTLIPSEYLPLENSFIPITSTAKTANISFSLKGKLADVHKAVVLDVSNISDKIFDYLKSLLKTLDVFDIDAQIFSKPSAIGSYKLNFDIEIDTNKQSSLFSINKDKLDSFLSSYFDFIANKLPLEEPNILEKNAKDSSNFNSVENDFSEIFSSANLPPPNNITDILVKNIDSSAKKLSEVTDYLKTNRSFDSIEISDRYSNNNFPIGLLTSNYREKINNKLLLEESLELKIEQTIDIIAQKYKIHVYSLNLQTGKGGAFIFQGQQMHKTALHINVNGKSLSKSDFTKSMDDDKAIEIIGIATKVNGKIKKLECTL